MASLVTDDGLDELAPPKGVQRLLSGSKDDDMDSVYTAATVGDATSSLFSGEKPSVGMSENAKATTPIQGSERDGFSLAFRVGAIKDPGVDGKENQDDYGCWEAEDGSTKIYIVLDGHGRELGKIASKAAKDAMLGYLTKPSSLANLRKDAPTVVETAFETAHTAVRDAFLEYYAAQGMLTQVEEGGYIVKRHPAHQIWH